ncbi:aminoacyltransferase [Staphylococcus equorum]|uniref:aminoacyltransferase n=1 Tax=Staphylococcus equorum TaxID=246432 RepID=UPI0024088ED1|nr:aminoacyltransferase [Staphylococcus equorum]MDG0823967.1 aminoacyltransferase [Staphylococcus equorum]
MNFVELTEKEFTDFINQNFVHYTQSTSHFHYRNNKKKDVHLVGVKEDKKVIAACLLTEARALRFFKYFYSHRGPVLDYSNPILTKFFFENLKVYLKAQKALFALIDPYILENIRDADGKIIEHYDNKKLKNVLSKLGYAHQGYSIGYSTTSQIRWLSVLNLKNKNESTILKEMDYQTRRNIKKTFEMGVEVKTLDISETNVFFELFQMAEEKHNFKFRDKAYFEEMQKIYANHSMLKLAYINLENYKQQLQKKNANLLLEIKDLENKLQENTNSKKTKTKLYQLTQQQNSYERKINQTIELISTEGNILNLAAAFYIYTKDEVYYLSSGSNPKYNQFMGSYRLQWDMITFAINNAIPRYNFYGITGDFSENSEDYGVQQFKKGFNAHVEEYIGDFIIPIRKYLYKLYLLNKNRHVK